MILIADSGSTKTEWCLIDNAADRKIFNTIGINPYQMKADAIKEVLEKELNPYLYPEKINNIYFYGAGCSTNRKCQMIENVFQDYFFNSAIEVHHDLLGAARALCGNEPGIACILGTGSNSCLFNGHEIEENVVSLGYLLGDEGSGAHMGKLLLADYFHGLLPAELTAGFEQKYKPSVETVLDALYNQPRPSRFLASFAPFISENIQHPYMRNLVSGCFDEFFRINVSKYTNFKDTKVHFLGSIAYHFSELLFESAEKAGVKTNKILKSAIDGLIAFHSN